MPLSVLVVLVVGGVAGIALVLHLAGLSRAPALREAAVRAGWARHFGDEPVAEVVLVPGGGAALVAAAGGPGLVRAVGADLAAHRIVAAERVPGGLRLAFGDFGAPPATVALPDDEAGRWTARVGAQREERAA